MKEINGEHAFVHENLAAYLAGGLDADERQRFDAHINGCPECFDAFTEARDADRHWQRTLGGLQPDAVQFEEEIAARVRRTYNGWRHPMIRRAAYATAAAVALAATGVFANVAMRQEGMFNNPLSRQLASSADSASPDLAARNQQLAFLFGGGSNGGIETSKLRGVAQSEAHYEANLEKSARPADATGRSALFKNAPARDVSDALGQVFGTATLPGVNLNAKMAFRYENTPVDTILTDLSQRFGFIIDKTATIAGRVTIQVPDPVNAEEALRLLNSSLYSIGYATVQSRAGEGPGAKTVLQVMSVSEARKAQIPVYEGADPDKIPLDDRIITQIIPLKNVSAVSLRNDLVPMISADADVTANSAANAIVITDTSAKIHRLAEVIQKLDNQRSIKTVIEYRQLINSNAADAARLVNSNFDAARTAGTTGRSASVELTGKLYASSDARTNTVVLNGPADQVGQAVEMLKRIEAVPIDNLATAYWKDGKIVERGRTDLVVNRDNLPDIASSRTDRAGGTSFAAGGGPSTSSNLNKVPVLGDIPVLLDTLKHTSPQDIGGGALAYDDGKAIHTNGGDAGFQFDLDETKGNLRKSTDINGNSISLGLLAGSDFGLANGRGEGREGDTPQPGRYAFGAGVSPSVTPSVTITGGGGTGATAPGDLTFGSLKATNEGVGYTMNAGGLTKAGTSTLTLSGTSTYSGSTNVSGGTLNVNGGTLTTSRTNPASTAVNFNGGALQASGTPANQPSDINWGMTVKPGEGEKVASLLGREVRAAEDPNGPTTAGSTSLETPISEAQKDAAAKLALGLLADGWVTDRTPAQKTTPRNGTDVGYGDAHSEFDRSAFWYTIPDLDNFYDKTSKTPMTDLFAAANPIAPVTPPAGGGTTSTAGASTTQPSPAAAQVAALKIIRNGTISFEVRSFDDTYSRIREIAALERGYIASTSSEKLANGRVRGTIVVRVPPERLDDFLKSLRGIGDLKAQQIGAADVTKQYYDIESELRGLVTMEARLLDLIKNGKGEVKDLIEAEKQLGDVRVRIEKLKGEISYYNNLVSLATITITAYEKDIQSPTAASVMEQIIANIQTEEVETKYQAARKIFDDAKGRIVESQLKNADAEHVAAHIVADVPPDQADFVANQLKQLGVVASFNRDRKQTNTGGTGAPAPGVQIEQKDTRFTVELFNLANLSPRETAVLQVAVRDVEGAYKNILGLVKTPPAAPPVVVPPVGGQPPAAPAAPTDPAARLTGRVTSSNLTGQVAEQMRADIRGELRAADADTILAAIRDSGEVISRQLNINQDNANTTAAKRGIVVTLVNIDAVNPKEADELIIAVADVDAAYNAALALIRREAPAGAGGAASSTGLLTPTNGRVLSSNKTGQPTDAVASIQAQLRFDQAPAVVDALRASGEVLSATVKENPDAVNFTRLKRGLALKIVSSAGIPAREQRDLKARAENVADAYRKLLDSLQTLAARNAGPGGVGGDVRIINTSLKDADPRSAYAQFFFEARRTALADVEKAFVAAGIEFPITTVVRSTDTASTLDSKVRFQIGEMLPAETMEPKRTITLGIQVANVERAVATLRSAATKLGRTVRESDFSISHESDGRVSARIVLDTVVSSTPTVLGSIDSLGGIPKSAQESRNAQAPETKSFTKERIDLTLFSPPPIEPIVKPDQGLGQASRAALSSAVGALLFGLYLVLTGLLFVVPFVLILWPIWAILKRRKTKPA